MSPDTECVHTMKPNLPRIIAAISKAIAALQTHGRHASQYDIVKTLFLADREHLNEWGRPITYDNYKAMEHGPVPSVAYDLLKNNEFIMRKHTIDVLPWTGTPVRGGHGKREYELNSPLDQWLHPLSESDLEALERAAANVSSMTFGQIRRLTHEDPAYLDAWPNGAQKGAYDMKLGLLFEAPNFERAAILEYQSEHV